jgi:hypothetical protein
MLGSTVRTWYGFLEREKYGPLTPTSGNVTERNAAFYLATVAEFVSDLVSSS